MRLLKRSLLPPLALSLVACVHVTSDVTALPPEDTPPVEEAVFSQAELDQMLAPIALYPDVLLSQVLMASTYPLEVVEASRWSRDHSELSGDEAVQAVEAEHWDYSVKALVAFPDLIQLMDENLSWTRRLGDAFIVQEEQVMETIQNLRAVALDEGQLDELEHLVIEEREEAIIIEPADVRVVYVPYYNTRYVYGNWWWYDYPPYYWGPPPVHYSSVGFHWSRGFRVSTSFYYSNCYWPSYNVVVVKPHKHHHHHHDFDRSITKRHYRRDAPVWKHDPSHRGGVRYREERLNDVEDRRRAVVTQREAIKAPESRQGQMIARNSQRPESRTGPVVKQERLKETRYASGNKKTEQRERTTYRPPETRRLAPTQKEGEKAVTRPSQTKRPGWGSVIAENSRQKPNTPTRSTKPSGNKEKKRGTVASNPSKPKQQPRAEPPKRQPPPTKVERSDDSGSSGNSRWTSNDSYASRGYQRESRERTQRAPIRRNDP
jgi:hypothetical protein